MVFFFIKNIPIHNLQKNAKDEFRTKNMQSDYETFFNDLSHEMTLSS